MRNQKELNLSKNKRVSTLTVARIKSVWDFIAITNFSIIPKGNISCTSFKLVFKHVVILKKSVKYLEWQLLIILCFS